MLLLPMTALFVVSQTSFQAVRLTSVPWCRVEPAIARTGSTLIVRLRVPLAESFAYYDRIWCQPFDNWNLEPFEAVALNTTDGRFVYGWSKTTMRTATLQKTRDGVRYTLVAGGRRVVEATLPNIDRPAYWFWSERHAFDSTALLKGSRTMLLDYPWNYPAIKWTEVVMQDRRLDNGRPGFAMGTATVQNVDGSPLNHAGTNRPFAEYYFGIDQGGNVDMDPGFSQSHKMEHTMPNAVPNVEAKRLANIALAEFLEHQTEFESMLTGGGS